MSLEYRVGDVFDRLAEIPDQSIDLIVTSPPFLALRSYLPADHPDKAKEIGSEATPAAFIDTLLALTAEFGRVLAPHGSLCVELGDTFSGSGGAGGDYNLNGLREGQETWTSPSARAAAEASTSRTETGITPGSDPRYTTDDSAEGTTPSTTGSLPRDTRNRSDARKGYGGAADRVDALKPGTKSRMASGNGWPLAKSLTGIPTLYPWSLAYGRNLLTGKRSPAGLWRIRNLIVWARPNPPVGALGDKFRPATSYITVACRGTSRFFDLDAVRGPGSPNTHARLAAGVDSRPNDTKVPPNGSNRDTLAIIEGDAGAPPLDWHTDHHPEDGDWLWKLPTQPYKGAHYACVDDQTEALTLTGWKSHDDLQDGEVIAAYDTARGVLTWQPATFHRYPFNGQLIAVNQRETVQRLTPNHRVLVRVRTGGTVRTIQASDLLTSHSVPLIAPFVDVAYEDVDPTWAALAGWFVTEGHAPPPGAQPRALIYQSETANPHHVATIRSLLADVGAEFAERKSEREWRGRPAVGVTFTVYGDVAARLRTFGKAIPASVLLWADGPLRLFMDALIDGDGHRRPSGRCQFICKNKADADMFQAIAARLGMRSTITQRTDNMFSTTIGQRTWATLRGTNGASRGVTTEHYEGVVWCPSVPSGYWLARRNGRPFITGNTFPLELPTRLIMAMCPLRVCRECGKPSERITDVEYVEPAGGPNGSSLRPRIDGRDGLPTRDRVSTTTGWSDCGHNAWRTGVTLDPFGGSGTVAQAAQNVGRHAILIDLDERNADLARIRVGMFMDVDA